MSELVGIFEDINFPQQPYAIAFTDCFYQLFGGELVDKLRQSRYGPSVGDRAGVPYPLALAGATAVAAFPPGPPSCEQACLAQTFSAHLQQGRAEGITGARYRAEMPCGSGKTFAMAAAIYPSLLSGGKVLWLTRTTGQVEQVARVMRKFAEKNGRELGGQVRSWPPRSPTERLFKHSWLRHHICFHSPPPPVFNLLHQVPKSRK